VWLVVGVWVGRVGNLPSPRFSTIMGSRVTIHDLIYYENLLKNLLLSAERIDVCVIHWLVPNEK
jgi:hypothetical protein